MPAEIQVDVKLNGTTAKTTIDSIEQAYQHLRKDFEQPLRLDKAVTALKRMGETIGTVSTSQASSLRYMTDFIRNQEGLANATVKATGALRNYAGTFQTYSVSTKNADNTTKNFRVSVNTATGDVHELDKGIKSATFSLDGFGKQAVSFAKQLVGFYGVTQSLRQAFNEMKNMSDEMVIYRKVTNATAQDMEKVRASAYETAKKYGQSPSDFIASAANMARAGYKEQSMAMAELATRTQLVGDMTADQASKFLIAVDAAYKYGGSIEQLSAVLDAANEIDNNFATSIEKISEGLTLVASVGSSAHVPIEQLMAALGTMTATTQRSGSEMARGLRSIILHVLGDTTTEIEEGVTASAEGIKTLTEALQEYGDESIKASIKAGKLVNPMQAIVALQKAYKEGRIREADLYEIGKSVAGQRYYNAFSSLIMNPEMYESMLQSITNSTGSAQKEIDAMMDSWSKKLEALKTTWVQLVNQSISEGFIKDLIDGGKAALEFAGNLENLGTMALGAYTAIKALSTGLSNLSKNQQFGGFNAASIGIGLAITIIGAIKSAYDNAQKELAQGAAKAAENAKNEANKYNSVLAIQKRYQEIVVDGIQEEKGEFTELQSLQSQLNDLVGDQATAVDLVNGAYDTQIEKLKKLNKEQKEAAKTKLQTELSTAMAKWASADLNGPENFDIFEQEWSETGAWVSSQVPRELFQNYKYLSRSSSEKYGVRKLFFKKGETAEDVIGLYNELLGLQEYLTNYTSSGEKVSAGMKSIAETKPTVYNNFVKFLETIKNYAEPIQSIQDIISTFDEDIENAGSKAGEASKNASEGMKDASKSAITLADAINKATAAKSAFDEAMKTSKADAFNDYVKAFETLQTEMNAGRVNSTAFYAAAEMLMGAKAYAATGGSSAAIRKALSQRTKGDSGSALDAYKILSDTYKDYSTGENVEGFGFVELLRRTKGYGDSFVSDKEGNIVIPALTSDQISDIANAWHIDSAFLMAAWNAFDQHDINGTRQQDDLMDRVQETSENAAEGEKTLADAETQAISAVNGLKSSFEGATDAVNTFASALNKEPQNSEEQNDSILSGAGSDKTRTYFEEFSEAIDDMNNKVLALKYNWDNLKMNQELIADANTLLSTMKALDKENGYELNIKNGEVTNTTTGKVTSIKSALEAIENMKQNGVISADVAGELKGNLLSDLETLGVEVQKYKDNPPGVTITGDAKPAEGTFSSFVKEVETAEPQTDIGATTGDAYDELSEFEDDVNASEPTATIDGDADPAKDKLKDFETSANNSESWTTIDANDDNAKQKIAEIEKPGHKTIYLEAKNAPKDENTNGGNTEPGVFLADGTPATAQDLLPEGFPSDTAVFEDAWWNTPDGEALAKKVAERWAKIQEATKTEEENYLQWMQDAVDAANKKVEAERAKAGENAGQAFVEAEKEAVEEEEEDVSIFGDPDAFTPKYSEAGKKAGEAFAEAEKEVVEDEEEDISVFNDPNAFTPAKNAAQDLNDQLSETAEKPVEIEVEDEEAKKDISNLTATQTKTIYVKIVGGGGFNTTERFATGTHNHPGGLSLVNDGSGPELIVNDGNAFIAGGGKPTIVNLSKGAKVFTAEETRQIFGGAIPAYEDGTSELIGSGSAGGLKLGNIGNGSKKASTTTTLKKITSKKKKSSGSKSSAAKVDEKAFSNLSTMVDYIIGRIGDALDEQLDVIDAQIDALKKAREAAEEQNKLEELQKNVTDALNERTVRYLGEDGKWHWMADQKNVQQAQKALKEYQDELAFNAQVNELENQKKALQDEYNEITKTWSQIKDAVNTPTGSLSDLINQVLSNGTAQQKAGAQAVSGTLIKDITGSIYTKNYDEALSSIAKATAGNPIMPGSGSASLASLIATAGAGATEASIADALKTAASPSASITGSGNTLAGGNQTNINYFIDGIKLGDGMENQPLSSIMKNLSVYTNTGVS